MSQLMENFVISQKSLSPCDSKPNCVSSLNFDDKNFIAPIPYSGSRDDAKKTLIKILKSVNLRGTVISSGNYIHSEFVSSLFGFTDDVEFLVEDHHREIQLKSASRVGFYDWGMNRRRIETIRRLFNAANES